MPGWGQTRHLAACAAVVIAVGCVSASPVCAEVRVEGDEAAVRVTADRASLGDVLAALKTRFRLSYNASIPLNREVTGVLSGTLHRVVVRLLDGYDFVVKRSALDGVEIVRVAERGRGHPASQPAPVMWRAALTNTASHPSRLPRN